MSKKGPAEKVVRDIRLYMTMDRTRHPVAAGTSMAAKRKRAAPKGHPCKCGLGHQGLYFFDTSMALVFLLV